jgi:hypothetical protein
MSVNRTLKPRATARDTSTTFCQVISL